MKKDSVTCKTNALVVALLRLDYQVKDAREKSSKNDVLSIEEKAFAVCIAQQLDRIKSGPTISGR
jgi:hypothetical protein